VRSTPATPGLRSPGNFHHSRGRRPINARRGIEKVFGWIKQWGGLRQFKVRGSEKVSAVFGLHVIAYNLVRLGNLLNGELEAA